MLSELTPALTAELAIRFLVDAAAMVIFVFGIYYQRYRDKELVIAAAMFNIFTFVVLVILSHVQFGIAAGFGLFAILAMFTLRSEEMGKTEITYLFGSIAIAVICAIQGTSLLFVGIVVGIVLVSAYLIDHPKVLSSVYRVRVTLDRIDPKVLSDPIATRNELSQRLGVDVMSFQITSVDYINDEARVKVFYKKNVSIPVHRASS